MASQVGTPRGGSRKKREDAVRVAVRARPLVPLERQQKVDRVVTCHCEKGEVELHRSTQDSFKSRKAFFFDFVYGEKSTQREVYASSCHDIVDSVLEGYNGTIFAYGQTGTGKTYTIEGDQDDDDPEKRGVIPNSFYHVIDHVSLAQGKDFLVRASHLEIYNEEIRDLLGHNPKARLDLKENPDAGVYVKDLSTFVVKDIKQLDHVMSTGKRNRTTGATLMNIKSSRSHSIFTITVESCETVHGREMIRVGKLNLVDLAGSERQSKARAEGERLKEATHINLSLSTLGMVISALVEGRPHIPYRDSKLTRLLQDSLGGNSRTVMIATISPADMNYEETANTLRYASQARSIKNKPRINEDPKNAMLMELYKEIARLKHQLEGTEEVEVPSAPPPHEHVKLAEEKARIEKELEHHRRQLEEERQERERATQQLKVLKEQILTSAQTVKATEELIATARDKDHKITELGRALAAKTKELDKVARKLAEVQASAEEAEASFASERERIVATTREEFEEERVVLMESIRRLSKQTGSDAVVENVGSDEMAMKVRALVADILVGPVELKKVEDEARKLKNKGEEGFATLKQHISKIIQQGDIALSAAAAAAATSPTAKSEPPTTSQGLCLDFKDCVTYPVALKLNDKGLNDLSCLENMNPAALKVLDVSENNLARTLSLTVFTNIKYLRAAHNSFTSLAVTAPRLVSLEMSHNKLPCLPSVRVFPSLQILDLSHNKMDGSIRDVLNCSKITNLDLSDNRFSWETVEEFEHEVLPLLVHLQKLQHLLVNGNPFCDSIRNYRTLITSSAGKLKTLNGVDVDAPYVVPEADVLLRTRSLLELPRPVMTASDGDTTKMVPKARPRPKLPPFRTIRDLTEDSINKLAGMPKGGLAKAKYPIYMELCDGRFGLVSLTGLKFVNASALKELDVSENKLPALDGLSRFTKLKRLRAAYNTLCNVSLSNPKLVFLDLSHNRLTKLPPLAKLPNLQVLDISDNQVQDSLAEVTRCPKMAYLDLSFNNLTFTNEEFEQVCLMLKGLKKLQSLHLYNNPFCHGIVNYRSTLLAAGSNLTELDDTTVTGAERHHEPRLQTLRLKRSERLSLQNFFFFSEESKDTGALSRRESARKLPYERESLDSYGPSE